MKITTQTVIIYMPSVEHFVEEEVPTLRDCVLQVVAQTSHPLDQVIDFASFFLLCPLPADERQEHHRVYLEGRRHHVHGHLFYDHFLVFRGIQAPSEHLPSA